VPARGRGTSATDQSDKTTIYDRDDADRLISVTGAANNLTQYADDTEGNRTSITDSTIHTTYFAYAELGALPKRPSLRDRSKLMDTTGSTP
jgi:YD repeat-containing protein